MDTVVINTRPDQHITATKEADAPKMQAEIRITERPERTTPRPRLPKAVLRTKRIPDWQVISEAMLGEVGQSLVLLHDLG